MTDEAQTPEARLDAALSRIGRRLDELETRSSDSDIGRLWRQGRNVLAPLVAVIAGVIAVLIFVEARATSIAKHEIDSGVTRAQVADQINVQVKTLPTRSDLARIETKIDELRRDLHLDDRIVRVEELLERRLPRATKRAKIGGR